MESLKELGETIIWDWLENLGYKANLCPIRSRTFVVSFHSNNKLSVSVKDSMLTDLDNKTNSLIIEKFGQEMESNRGVKMFCAVSQ